MEHLDLAFRSLRPYRRRSCAELGGLVWGASRFQLGPE